MATRNQRTIIRHPISNPQMRKNYTRDYKLEVVCFYHENNLYKTRQTILAKATTNCIVVSRPGYGYNSVRAGGDFYYSLWMW